MSKTNIYVIRHGQSMGNLQDWFVGYSDIELTDLGREQAEMTAAFLDSICVDAIYSSDLSRAYHTAQATAKRKNLPITTDPGLREIFGGEWECQVFAELVERYPEEIRLWRHAFAHSGCPGGESVVALRQRITTAVENIAKENPGKSICIFSHAAAIRTLTAAWLGLSPEKIQDHPYPSNASVSHAVYEDGKFRLVEYSRDDFMGDKVTRLPIRKIKQL